MAQSHASEILSPIQRNTCECYKKLREFGIPLYVADENDLYSENPKVIPYENAFQFPGILKIKEVSSYPNVEENELYFVFEQMVQILPNLSDFEQNVLSFWILDVFIEGLWTAQNAKMSHSHQRATLLWIAYFFNYIQRKWRPTETTNVCKETNFFLYKSLFISEQNPSRREMFYHLKTVLFTPSYPEENIGEDERQSPESFGDESGEGEHSNLKKAWKLPLPPDLPASYNDFNSFTSEDYSSAASETDKTAKSSLPSPFDLKEEETDTETNIKHMNIILEILYRIFGRLWVFLELQTVFHAMPAVEQVDLPFILRPPKPLYRAEPSIQIKPEKSGKRPSHSEKSSEEMETERQLHKSDYILPLQVAEESKLYLKQIFGQLTSDRSVLTKHKEERSKK